MLRQSSAQVTKNLVFIFTIFSFVTPTSLVYSENLPKKNLPKKNLIVARYAGFKRWSLRRISFIRAGLSPQYQCKTHGCTLLEIFFLYE